MQETWIAKQNSREITTKILLWGVQLLTLDLFALWPMRGILLFHSLFLPYHSRWRHSLHYYWCKNCIQGMNYQFCALIYWMWIIYQVSQKKRDGIKWVSMKLDTNAILQIVRLQLPFNQVMVTIGASWCSRGAYFWSLPVLSPTLKGSQKSSQVSLLVACLTCFQVDHAEALPVILQSGVWYRMSK